MNCGQFIGAAAVAALLSVGALSPAQGRPLPPAPGQLAPFASLPDCYIDPQGLLDLDYQSPQAPAVGIASTCEEAARKPSRRPPSIMQLSFAYYHAAKANRLRAEALLVQNDQGAAPLLEQSDRQFRAAMSINPSIAEAPLELARVHRLQSRFEEARNELTDIGRIRPGDPAVSYEQAMVALGFAARRGTPADVTASLRNDAFDHLSGFGNAGLRTSAYVFHRGPLQLANLANALGRDALAQEPPTPDLATIAAKRFERAKMAVDVIEEQQRAGNLQLVDRALAAEIYFNLGRALLRQTAKDTSAADSTGCGAPTPLQNDLQRTFEEASRRGSRDASWGLGCVQLTRGDYAGAISLFKKALPQPNTTTVLPPAEYHLALARALVRSASGAPSVQIQQEAVASYNAALAAQTDPSRRVAIQLELADAYKGWGMLRDALAGLSRAVGASFDSDYDPAGDTNPIPDAYLVRGLILEDLKDYRNALANYLAAATTPWPGRARAYNRLARQTSGAQAVQYATDAYLNAANDAERKEFQRSACLMRIIYDRTADQGQFYCSADRRDDPDALFYEGVFWLREAYRETGGNQRRNWAQALRAFEAGLAVAQPGQRQTVLGDDYGLRETLTYGKRFALQCSGLGAANAAEQGDSASERERALFTGRLGLNRCWR